MAAGRKTGGRQKGTPNKMSKALKDMVLGALDDVGGQQYLARMSQEQPKAFMALLGRVLPTTSENRVELVQRAAMVDERVAEADRALAESMKRLEQIKAAQVKGIH
jgi:hypothetical protein